MTFDAIKRLILLHANDYKEGKIEKEEFEREVDKVLSVYLKVI